MKPTYLKKSWSSTLALRRASATRQPANVRLIQGSNFSQRRRLITLAIETSADDTCVAVLEKNGPAARLLFNKRVTADNSLYGGIHPNVTVASHNATLAPLVREAISHLPPTASSASDSLRRPDFVSVTRGPGMLPSLSSGLNVAKGLAVAWGVPLLGINHMQAHALTPRLVNALKRTPSSTSILSSESQTYLPTFPFMSLLVSGGHTLLVRSVSTAHHTILAKAEHIAIGDVLDKVARAILPPKLIDDQIVAYAPLLEDFAFPASPTNPSAPKDYSWYTAPAKRLEEIQPYEASSGRWSFQALLKESRAMQFDFSLLNRDAQALKELFPLNGVEGLDEAAVEKLELEERREIARATMKIAFDHLASRVIFALQDEERKIRFGGREETDAAAGETTDTLVVSGGVASNRFLMHVLRSVLDVRGYKHVKIVSPPPALCTDNAAMVAWAGMEMYEAGWRTKDEAKARRKWPIDPEEDGGILGVDGWYRED